MVRSHAKHNTTQSTLTHYERSLLRRENEARRVGQDSFKPLDHCNLCLSNIFQRDPVSCSSGHIYCKECVLTNLITQKASIEASKRELERWEDNEARERFEARQKARERVISDFEKGMGLGQGIAGRKAIDVTALANGNGKGGGGIGGGEAGQRAMEKLQEEAEDRALKKIEEEQIEARKSKLAAFWLPSLTPEAKLGPVKEMKLQPMCHVGGQQHPLTRKSILPVIFSYPPGSTSTTPTNPALAPKEPKPICPSCSRDLSNSNHSILLSSKSPAVPTPTNTTEEAEDERPKKKSKKEKPKDEPFICGHVVCKTCADTIVKESQRCCVCEAGVTADGMIPLGKEGTGFAAAGGAEVKRNVTTFRV